MADDEENGIDSRYDPAFQRGYRGGGTTESARRRAAADSAGPVTAPTVPVVGEPTASAATARVVEIEAGTESNANADGSESDVAPLNEILPPLRTNPYVYALGVMGGLFVLGGIGIEVSATLAAFSTRNGYQGTPISLMIGQNIAYVMTGPLITIGLAIFAGLLFFAGARRSSLRNRNTP